MLVSKLSKIALAVLAAFALSSCGGGHSHSGGSGQEQPSGGSGQEEQSGGQDSDTGSASLADVSFTCDSSMSGVSLFKDYDGVSGEAATDEETPEYSHTVAVDFDDLKYAVDGGEQSPLSDSSKLPDGVVFAVGDELVTVDISGADGNLKFVLSGTLEKSIDVTAAKNARIGLELDGAVIKGGNYPAIAIGPKTATVYVTLKGENTLSDSREFGTGYSSANGVDYYDTNAAAADIADDAQQTQTWALGSDDNGVLSTKGTLRISGDGTLNVETNYKHGLYAKNRIYMFGGNVGVYNQGRNGIQSKNGFDMSGGTVLLCGLGTHTNKQSRGIIVSGDESEDGAGLGGISISGGVIGIRTTGKAISAKWDIEEDAETNDTADDPSPVVSISGGTIGIVTTASVVDSDFSSTVSYYDEDGLLVTEKESCSPEGIEGKLGVDISGGTIAVSSTDDALNASRDITSDGRGYVTIRDGNESPRVWLKSSSADAIDSNGDINIEGGVVVAISSLGSEDGFDCDGALNFRGGLAVGISGSSHVYAKESSDNDQNVFVLSSSYAGKPGTSMAIANSAGKAVFAFEIPSDISSYGIMTLSSPDLSASDTYSIVSGATLSGGSGFGGLYEEMPGVSGGTNAGTITTSSGTRVYTIGSSGQSEPGGTPPSQGGTPPGWSAGGVAAETLP